METEDAIYMVEVKSAAEMDNEDVKGKMKAALRFCGNATDYTAANGGKPWKYLLIPHDQVQLNSSFDYLVGTFERK